MGNEPVAAARSFDGIIGKHWSMAEAGFAVTATGDILSPAPYSRQEARAFLADNSRFLANRESVEVYLNPKQYANSILTEPQTAPAQQLQTDAKDVEKNAMPSKVLQARNVSPQQQFKGKTQGDEYPSISRLAASETEFRQLVGQNNEGMLARFVDNKLNVLVWYRPPTSSNVIVGAKLSLPRLLETIAPIISDLEPDLRSEVCLALLDDTGKPALRSHADFEAPWKRPFVATEIGEVLPHWEAAVYLLNPAKLTQSASTLKLTLGLVIALLVAAIGVGSWLITADISRQVALARQKTDFVSNVSHELKTPLTSIRMFSELLAEGRVQDAQRQKSYLNIITSEAARLTRLINNVLDFARIERGEKKYAMREVDLTQLTAALCEQYRPHLENVGFQFVCELPLQPVAVTGDGDALSQVIVNLLSNAEKYSDHKKDILLSLKALEAPLPHAQLDVLDHGNGVPEGSEEKIFEQFYRAHDSLSSGIQGSGLGLTLARQIARAHGGDVVYTRRPEGGSCFSLRLPLTSRGAHQRT
jgi:signal transduction histidine kinase